MAVDGDLLKKRLYGGFGFLPGRNVVGRLEEFDADIGYAPDIDYNAWLSQPK